jgi:multiple sugar transport system substrate-binding protein
MQKLSRREMLKLSGCLAAGSLLAGCTTSEEPVIEDQEIREDPNTRRDPIQVIVLHSLHEFTFDHINNFEDENPGITIEIVDDVTANALYFMYASGTPPDICRLQAPAFPGFLARGLLLDLTPYFESSQLIDIADLAPANDYYRADSPFEIGLGKIYGMVKDFSPDFTIFANAALFEDAGLRIPDDTKALTYEQIMAASRELTIFDGDIRVQYGYGYEINWIDRIWLNMLAETGDSFFSESYDTLNISGNEEARAVLRWFYEMAVENLTPSSRNPSPTGWFASDFPSNFSAMTQCGYWFSPMAISDANIDSAMMLPGPTWTGVRRNPTITATGAVVTSACQEQDATWKVYEYYHAGDPAIERAVNGMGVPALNSYWDLLPQGTDFQKQVYKVLQGELALNTEPLQFTPFLSELTLPDLWDKYLDQALVGDITFDEMIAGIESEANVIIKDNIDSIMG